jgi:hypothetical protein
VGKEQFSATVYLTQTEQEKLNANHGMKDWMKFLKSRQLGILKYCNKLRRKTTKLLETLDNRVGFQFKYANGILSYAYTTNNFVKQILFVFFKITQKKINKK